MSGRVLDLACHHGPDSCLIQASYPGRFELYGCDIGPGSQHTVFHGYSGMTYRQVTDTTRIPFESEMFDGVVGSGALEHTAWDYECLKEVYRVLRPGGVFIITYLPNWVSWKEWYCQLVLKNGYHLRRYSKSELRWLLKHTGFRPLTIQCQNVGALGLTGKEWLWRQLVEWVRPDRYFRTVLCGVAHKMTVM
ncbi:MAG: class I SAM-dependent methyltransferase [Gemmataceae bacterium]